MRSLLDTDIVVYHLRGKYKLKEKIIKAGVAISIITFGELLYGAYKSSNKQNSVQLIQEFISDLQVDILGLNQEIMNIYAKTKVFLEEMGKRLDEFDLLIGATAIAHSLPLATSNLRHFERIPDLKIVPDLYIKPN